MFYEQRRNIAVIGCGYWGKNYIRLLSQMAEVDLVALCDRDKDQLMKNKTRILSSQSSQRLRLFLDYKDLLQMEELEAVVICTNPSMHFEMAQAALLAGKHVLIEKPMTLSSESAKALIDLAAEKNRTLMVGHIFLYNSAVNEIKKYITEGRLGQIYYLYSKRTNLGPIRSDVNAIWDLAPHDISIFNYLLEEEPEWVSATASSFLQDNTADMGSITLGYPGGKLGLIHVSWADPHKEREVVVVGSEQRVVFNDISQNEKVIIYQKGVSANHKDINNNFSEYEFLIRDGEILLPAIDLVEPLHEEVKAFLNCIDGYCQNKSDGNNGLAVIRVLEAIDQSIQSRGKPIYLNA